MRQSFPINISSFIHHRIKPRKQQDYRCILGGGLRGLVWGITWLNEGDRVSVIDDRQEIGTPSRRVGWLISEGIGFDWLQEHITLAKAQYNPRSEKFHSGLRVEWLEKLLTISFLKLGGQIISRTFASHSNNEITIEGTSSAPIPTDWTTIHNATGRQPPSPGADGIPLNVFIDHKWEGGVMSSHMFETKEIESSSLILERVDKTLEIWFEQDKRPISTHWLELLETYRSSRIDDLEISAHIERILIQHRESHDL